MGQMRKPVSVSAGTLTLFFVCWTAGCDKKTEANADGGDGSLTIPDGPLAGRRAFDVVASLRSDGSAQVPPTNRFTLVLDGDARLAIVGGNGRGAIIGVTTNDGRTFRSAGTFSVGGDGTPCSGTTAVHYDNFELTIAGDGFTGTATGTADISCGDCSFLIPVGATLTGTADTTPPRLRGSGFTPANPFDPVGLMVTEPLPAGATARLVADDGTSVDLVPTIVDGIEPLVVGFTKPAIVLRAGQGYAVPFDGLVDFAGQSDRAGPSLRLAAFVAAPLVPEDGFESVTETALGGAIVMTGGPLPAIAGNTSLYVGSAGAPAIDSSMGRSLTVRLARQASETRLRFSYRVVAAQAQSAFAGTLRVGSEGASPGTPTYSFGDYMTVTQQITVGGKTAYTGPVSALDMALPIDATGEVLLIIAPTNFTCGPIPISNAGMLIDDLRLE